MPRSLPTPEAVLITGAAKRIGKITAMHLAHRGYAVALHYNQAQREAIDLRDQIRRKGGRCEVFPCDLTSAAAMLSLVPRVIKIFPKLSVLINNASQFTKSRFREITLEQFHRDFSIHLMAPLFLSRDFSKFCKRGHIINILDTHITSQKTQYFLYLLAKKSLHALTQMLAMELAPHFRVNAIAPGLILPPAGKGDRYLKKLSKKVPLKDKGDPWQIVQSVEFLLNNPCMTGQVIFNDGGEHLL